MNCLIVDDNKMARMAMKQLVSQVKELTVVAECADAMSAYNAITAQPVDLLLLDIEMPGMTGIELTRHLGSRKPLIIFTTSKNEYAVEAFELNVVDYLVKPVLPGRFLQGIEKARDVLDASRQTLRVEEREFVFVRDSGALKRIAIPDILYMEAMGDYVKVYTPAKFHLVHTTLKSIEEKLSGERFMRVHRSYIIAIDKIDAVEDGVISIGKAEIPVADAYRSPLQQRLPLL